MARRRLAEPGRVRVADRQQRDRAAFERAEPGLAGRIGKAFGGQSADPGGDQVWVGGTVPVPNAEQPADTGGGIPLGVYLGILLAIVVGIVAFVLRARKMGTG